MKGIKVCVTKQHIADGKRATSTQCPIALALIDKLGLGRNGARPSVSQISIELIGKVNYWMTPEKLARKINDYDTTGLMSPFCFTVPRSKIVRVIKVSR